jgi:hypothetical protein
MATVENTLTKIMDNPIVVGVVAIVLAMYGPRLSPKLPSPIRNAFNHSFFRFIIMLLVIFVSLRDIRLSLVVAILFMILMSAVMNQNIKEDFEQQINEYYSNYNLYNSVEHFENPELDAEEQAQMDAELNNASSQNVRNNNQQDNTQQQPIDNQRNNMRQQQPVDNQRNNMRQQQPVDNQRNNMRQQQQDNQRNNMRQQQQDNQMSDTGDFRQQMNEITNNVNNNPELGLSNKCKDYFNNKKQLYFEQGTTCLDEYTNKVFNSLENTNSNEQNINSSRTNNRRNLQDNSQGLMDIKNNIQKACDMFNNNYSN